MYAEDEGPALVDKVRRSSKTSESLLKSASSSKSIFGSGIGARRSSRLGAKSWVNRTKEKPLRPVELWKKTLEVLKCC